MATFRKGDRVVCSGNVYRGGGEVIEVQGYEDNPRLVRVRPDDENRRPIKYYEADLRAGILNLEAAPVVASADNGDGTVLTVSKGGRELFRVVIAS